LLIIEIKAIRKIYRLKEKKKIGQNENTK